MTHAQLDALEALLAKATPGPWQRKHAGNQDEIWSHERGLVAELSLYPHGSEIVDANSALIQELRNNAAALIAAAREALELREALEFAADVSTTLVKESAASYSCWRTDAWGEVHQYAGATPLEAINKARRGI